MPRKGPVPKREILPDPIYNSRLVARFVNRLMYDGKKGPAETIVYRALENLSEKSGEEALRAFEKVRLGCLVWLPFLAFRSSLMAFEAESVGVAKQISRNPSVRLALGQILNPPP